MDRKTAELLMQRLAALDHPLNEVAKAIEAISDTEERKKFRRGIATVMGEAYAGIMAPILRLYPDLDPDKDLARAPDGPMTPEQEAIAASLSPSFVQKIDDDLLLHAGKQGRKVAMIVGSTMMNDALTVPGLPDLFYAQRVKALVQKGLLIAEGNLEYMRFSEVRLP